MFNPTFDGRDHCSRNGAYSLAARIAAYWVERGDGVAVRVEKVDYDSIKRSSPADLRAVFAVRSDMFNGLPVTRFMQKNPAA